MNFDFNVEETNLLAAFNVGNRSKTLDMLEDMERLISSVSYRLRHMTDEEFIALELVPVEEALDA